MMLRLFSFLLAAGALFFSGMISCSSPGTTGSTTSTSGGGSTTSNPAPGTGNPAAPVPTPPPAAPAPDLDPPFNSKTVVQMTDNDDDESWGQNNFWSTTSRGRILWQRLLTSGEREIVLGRADGSRQTLSTSPEDVDFMALGSGAGADEILASWREDLSETFVGDAAAAPLSLGKHNQEENTIADGCLFYRDSTNGPINHEIARYSQATGQDLVSQASFADSEPVTSGCQAVWLRDGSLVYFDGAAIVPVSAGPFNGFDFRDGRIVYSQGGDVFLYDAAAVSPAPVNLTNAPGELNRFPRTDGKSVVFTRDLGGGTHQVVLREFDTGDTIVLSTTNAPKDGFSLRMDREQAIWMEGGTLYFFDGTATDAVNTTPATAVNEPHLADGIVTWYGPTGAGTDLEIFIMK